MASALTAQAVFVAGLGRFDEARELIGRARALLQDVGLTVWLAGPHAQFAGWIELLAGEPAAAEAELRWGYRKLEQIGELGWLSTVVALLAEAVYLQGRRDEATALARLSEESAGTEDVYSQVLWRGVRAKVLAAGGERVDAERLAREASVLAGTTDFLLLRWHALMNQTEVRLIAHDGPAAEAALIEAIHLAAQKGNVVAEGRARDLLARVRSSAQA
jgi:ATP/maltotriose-dependent transcriptional regulator MalT